MFVVVVEKMIIVVDMVTMSAFGSVAIGVVAMVVLVVSEVVVVVAWWRQWW